MDVSLQGHLRKVTEESPPREQKERKAIIYLGQKKPARESVTPGHSWVLILALIPISHVSLNKPVYLPSL